MDRFDALGPDLQAAMFRDGELPGTNEVEVTGERLRRVFERG